MNKYVLAAALALLVAGGARAAVIDLSGSGWGEPAAQPLPDMAAAARTDVVAPPSGMSELPEPEVFAMMLVGLVLIGYRARRDSSDKFK